MNGYIMLTVRNRREGKYYVAECVELGTSSFGTTEEEATRNVLDATVEYLNTLEELGECADLLKEKGIHVYGNEPAAKKIIHDAGGSYQSAVVPLQGMACA